MSQKCYGLDLDALDPDTYKRVKRQLDRVNEVEVLRNSERRMRTKMVKAERRQARAEAVIAEKETSKNDKLFNRLSRILSELLD